MWDVFWKFKQHIGQSDGGYRFDNGNRAGKYAGVVSALRQKGSLLFLRERDALLGLHNSGGRLEGAFKDYRHTV